MTPSGYSDIFAISIHRHGLFFLVNISNFGILGVFRKMAILGVGRFKWILCCPLLIFFFFFFFFFFFLGGVLFNVKFKLFFIVFSAISNILYKQERTINTYKNSFSRVSNAISKPSSKIVGSKIVKKIEGGQSTKLSPAT